MRRGLLQVLRVGRVACCRISRQQCQSAVSRLAECACAVVLGAASVCRDVRAGPQPVRTKIVIRHPNHRRPRKPPGCPESLSALVLVRILDNRISLRSIRFLGSRVERVVTSLRP